MDRDVRGRRPEHRQQRRDRGGVTHGAASGVAALSSGTDAHVTNSGDISTYSSAALSHNSVGITAFAANGDAHVENSRSVDAGAK